MVDNKLRNKVAILNPYKSVIKSFDVEDNKYLVGIKNVESIPNTIMKKLENYNYMLHTLDKKSQLAGRAVDTELINPISGKYMSGSSSGTAINVFSGINHFGIGADGGGSVLAPAISLNIIGFISKLLPINNTQLKKNTDNIIATNSVGFMSKNIDIIYDAINIILGIKPSCDTDIKVVSDKKYDNVTSQVIEIMDPLTSREKLTKYLSDILKDTDVFVITEGPIDLDGFGDSLFGHFDERTKEIQNKSNKGYVRVCNIANATALCIPQKELGVSILLMCDSVEDKIAKLLKIAEKFEVVKDPLIERYFGDLNNYFSKGYII